MTENENKQAEKEGKGGKRKKKEEEQQLQPPTPQPAFAVNQAPTLDTSLTGVEFGTLFPDDPMGQMIAERRQKRNEQSG